MLLFFYWIFCHLWIGFGFGRRRRDEDVPTVANVEAKFFSSEKELEVNEESLKKDAETRLGEMEKIIISETDPNAEEPPFEEEIKAGMILYSLWEK